MIVGGSGVSITPAIEEIKVNIGEKGSQIVPGISRENYICTFRGRIIGWKIVGYPSGSIEIDVLKRFNNIPQSWNTIAGSEIPSLSAQQINSDMSLSTWTNTNVEIGDVFGINILNNDVVETAVLTISIMQA